MTGKGCLDLVAHSEAFPFPLFSPQCGLSRDRERLSVEVQRRAGTPEVCQRGKTMEGPVGERGNGPDGSWGEQVPGLDASPEDRLQCVEADNPAVWDDCEIKRQD